MVFHSCPIRVTDVLPACPPVCVFNLKITRLVMYLSATGPLKPLGPALVEECEASGVKVFSLTIWLALILWSASKDSGCWFISPPEPWIIPGNELNFCLWFARNAWFAFSRRRQEFSLFVEIDGYANYSESRKLNRSLSASVCRPTCFPVLWCTSAPTSKQVFLLGFLLPFLCQLQINICVSAKNCNLTRFFSPQSFT